MSRGSRDFSQPDREAYTLSPQEERSFADIVDNEKRMRRISMIIGGTVAAVAVTSVAGGLFKDRHILGFAKESLSPKERAINDVLHDAGKLRALGICAPELYVQAGRDSFLADGHWMNESSTARLKRDIGAHLAGAKAAANIPCEVPTADSTVAVAVDGAWVTVAPSDVTEFSAPDSCADAADIDRQQQSAPAVSKPALEDLAARYQYLASDTGYTC